MDILTKYAHQFVQLELLKAKLEVFPNKNGREEVDLIVRTSTGKQYELYFQPIDLEKERSVKILKEELGDPKVNLWIALVLLIKDMEPVLHLIPSKVLSEPDNYIFFDNEQGERFKHLSNWEIKVFVKAIPALSKYSFANMLTQLV